MSALARRRRARFERRRIMAADPDNAWRARNCAQQMEVFDGLTAEARAHIRDNVDNIDTVDTLCRVRNAGLGETARAVLRARGVMACDVPLPELVSLEILKG